LGDGRSLIRFTECRIGSSTGFLPLLYSCHNSFAETTEGGGPSRFDQLRLKLYPFTEAH